MSLVPCGEGTALTDKEKENFQKQNPESGKLHPTPQKRTHSPNQNFDFSSKMHIVKRSSVHSKYIGVFWCGQTSKWHANWGIGNKKISYGRHMTEEAAALAYDLNMRKLVKRLNRYNFPAADDKIASERSDQELAKFPDEKAPQDDELFGPGTALDKREARKEVDNEF